MCVCLKNKYLKVYFILVLLVDACFLYSATPERAQVLVEKYSSAEFLDPIFERAQVLEEKYTSPEFIDKHENIERDRALAQEEFKNKVIFDVNLPINENGMQISVSNRDWMLLLAVSSQWLVDFVFFKMLSSALKDSLQDLCLQQPEKFLDLLKKLDDSLVESGERKNDAQIKENATAVESFVSSAVRASLLKFIKSGAIFALVSNAINRIKNHYGLDARFKQNLMDFVLMNVFYNANKAPVDNSLTEFLKNKSVAGFDFDLVQTTALDIATSFLSEHEILPAWVNGNKFDFVRSTAFASLYIWWSNKNIYKPIAFSFLVSNRKQLIQILEKASGNDLNQQKLAKKELEDVLKNIPQCSFALWESNKRKKFAQWQTVLNLLVLSPVVFKAGVWVYNISQNRG